MILIATVCCGITAQGHDNTGDTPDIRIERLQMKRVGDFIHVYLKLDLTALHIASTEVAVLTPRLTNGTDSVALQAVSVYGRNRHIYYQRNPNLRPTTSDDMEYKTRQHPDTLAYHATVHFEQWMDGCSLKVSHATYGCCGKALCSTHETLVPCFPLPPYTPRLIYIRPAVEAVKTRELSGSAFVDFPVSQTTIYPDYRNNLTELAKITGSIDSVKADPDITITALSIKGYASPESPYDNNTRLAKGRTQAVKEYVENIYQFDREFVQTSYEPEDWQGLEAYVEASSLPHRDEILAAIRSDREPDHKEAYIKANWRDDYTHLLEHCYPALRRTDYRITYVIRQYTPLEDIERVMNTAPQKLSLNEFYMLAQSYEPGSEMMDELWEIAVRMYPHDEGANLNAANTAILKGDYARAMRYLNRAGEHAEATYSRGVLEAMQGNYMSARVLLHEASQQGISEAQDVANNMRNRWEVTIDRTQSTHNK